MSLKSKVMVAFGPQTISLLNEEAKERGVSVQELLRAVIIPEWFRHHYDTVGRPLRPIRNKFEDTRQSVSVQPPHS